jgi:hypothetical protein
LRGTFRPTSPPDRSENASDAFAHFAGGFVRECHGENVSRIDAFDVDQSSDARRENAGLARSRAGENEQRPVDVQHGLALRRIQPAVNSSSSNIGISEE